MIFKIVVHLISRRISCFNCWHKLFNILEQRHYIGFDWLLLCWCSAFIRFWILIIKDLPNMTVHNELLSLDPACWIWPCNLRYTLHRSSPGWSCDKEPMLSSEAWSKSGGANRDWYWTCNLMRYYATRTCIIPCSWCTWNQIRMDLSSGYTLGSWHSTLQLSASPELMHELTHCVIVCLSVESWLWRSR